MNPYHGIQVMGPHLFLVVAPLFAALAALFGFLLGYIVRCIGTKNETISIGATINLVLSLVLATNYEGTNFLVFLTIFIPSTLGLFIGIFVAQTVKKWEEKRKLHKQPPKLHGN